MTFDFLYEDGQGNVVNENGIDPMDGADESDDGVVLEILTDMTSYLNFQQKEVDLAKMDSEEEHQQQQQQQQKKPKTNSKTYTIYSDDLKVLVIQYYLEKLTSAAKAGREYNVDERTAQRWIKEYKKQQGQQDQDMKKNKPGVKKILGDEHKTYLKKFIDDNPSAVLDQVVDGLTQQFEGLKIQKSAVHKFMTGECNITFKKAHFHALARNNDVNIEKRYNWILQWRNSDMDYMKNCVFIDESGFHINLRRSMAWADKGETPIVKVATTRAITHSILGAICAAGVVNTSIRKPNVKRSKKRKTGSTSAKGKAAAKGKTTGTTTSHYIKFLNDTMDIMDKYPEFKNCYLVMDNAPIHQSKNIELSVTERGYQCIYLPPYSPELNPIEQFWSKVKYSIKREALLDSETLSSRISEACNMVTHKDLHGYIRHSISRFDDCLNGNPI